MEVPRLGVESELLLPAYTTATAIQDLSYICNLHHSSRQRWILNPLEQGQGSNLRPHGCLSDLLTTEPLQELQKTDVFDSLRCFGSGRRSLGLFGFGALLWQTNRKCTSAHLWTRGLETPRAPALASRKDPEYRGSFAGVSERLTDSPVPDRTPNLGLTQAGAALTPGAVQTPSSQHPTPGDLRPLRPRMDKSVIHRRSSGCCSVFLGKRRCPSAGE